MNKQQMMRNFCLYRKEDERMEQESKPKKKKKTAQNGRCRDQITDVNKTRTLSPSPLSTLRIKRTCSHAPIGTFVVAFPVNVTRVTL